MTNLKFFIGAYFVFWLAILVYLFLIHRRQKAIQRMLNETLSQTKEPEA